MVSYSSPSSSHSLGYSSTIPPLGTAQTKDLAEQLRDTWKSFYLGGAMSGPAKMLSDIAYSTGRKEAGNARGRILSTPGLTSPAKAKMVGELERQSIEGAVGAPLSVYQSLGDKLASLLGSSSVSISKGSSNQGAGVGVCSCENLKALNEGKLDENLRRFRDTHFKPQSDIDHGYKAMAGWFVPLIKKHPFLMWLGRQLLLLPLCRVSDWLYGESKTGYLFLPMMYFWIWFWKLYGRVTRKRFSERTPRRVFSAYPPMTLTFLLRLKGGF